MPAVVHLLGYPGTGKRTVGAALVASVPRDEHRFVLVDNHLTGKAVLAALDTDSAVPIDPRVWTYVHDLRVHVLAAIEEMAPAGWSYVFTNYVVEEKPSPTLARLRALAEARRSTYVPVVLHCGPDELRRRVVGPDRAAHHKWTDPDGVMADVAGLTLVRPDSPHLLDLDVTHLTPPEAAARVLAHVRAVT
ncbi:hypothetical protein HC251_00195 [Iamia sp. SCSIO 61187]|uniref:AAA family ATPase n=1 Tax=Iamia sp. SCSIO 61187 TaxID=2722752 RepID=UPI001C62DAFA|nr:AAA family ATPase [Iamia sp. SCSIO 61187]QYG91005.1 hypothetical protein HC251_00195 [Iamia sp. SCSIO 61187]